MRRFRPKVEEHFRKPPSSSHPRPVTVMRSVSSGLKAATLFAEMSLLIHASTLAHTHTYKCKRTSAYAHHLIGLCEHKAHVQMLTLLHTPFQYFGICISLRCFIYRRPYAHTLPHKHALSIICRTFFACGKMTLLSFIFTSLPLRLARERGRRGEGEGEREREREEKKKVPKTANLLQRRVIDSGMGN